MALPDLGLDSVTVALLARKIDLIIHCAATTDFNASEGMYQNVNIDGVANTLATLPDARFLHVSTAYVCGLQDGPIAKVRCDTNQKFSNGYERSKAAGEALVLATLERMIRYCIKSGFIRDKRPFRKVA